MTNWRNTVRNEGAVQPDDGRQTWLVGAVIDGADITDEFIETGTWRLSPKAGPKDRKHVQRMAPGDRIAIKAAFTQKRDLPFDAMNRTVSVMRIKARGVVERVAEKAVVVAWERLDPTRDWYFYTHQQVVWRLPDNELAQGLAAFVFDDVPQSIDYYLTHPFWADRYGARTEDLPETSPDDPFHWIPFYEAVATALLDYRDDRGELARWFVEIRKNAGLSAYMDKTQDGTEVPVRDMCPFTFMNLFNLGQIGDEKRSRIAADAGERLGVDLPAPTAFTGIPTTFPIKSWMFPFEFKRTDHIDRLWQVFDSGLAWADSSRSADKDADFRASLRAGFLTSNWQMATGLFRARPAVFYPMDERSQILAHGLFGLRVPPCRAERATDFYRDLLDRVAVYVTDPASEHHSIAAMSHAAWEGWAPGNVIDASAAENDPEEAVERDEETKVADAPAYGLDDLMRDGCFLPRDDVQAILNTLSRTKNVILQGAPGTGKTWLAQRLGWILAGRRRPDAVRVVQFHPNTSYEDFVRGYRPRATDEGGAAGLILTDGPFLRLADLAKATSEVDHVMVIEEINRGNPARSLGEMLTLIEASKRSEDHAMNLTYVQMTDDKGGVWLPPNLHVVGTMNIADRSVALVDLALRRRFSFITLEPQLNEAWMGWTAARVRNSGVDAKKFVGAVKTRIDELNGQIRADPSLGKNFVIGHSFVTPVEDIDDAEAWYREQVETSLRPLLHEYWFDDPDRADTAADRLLAVWA